MDKIDTWIENRFGTKNTFNRQLLDNFIEFLEKELGYVIKDPDQSLPEAVIKKLGYSSDIDKGQLSLIHNGWVKVKEKSNE